MGIGLAFWEAIPRIERYRDRIRLLTALVVFGGLLQLATLLVTAVPDGAILFGVLMALVVAPLICVWQGRVARRFAHATMELVGQR